MSRQLFFDDVPFFMSLKLASVFLPFPNELQFHAMMLLLLNVSLFTLILHEQQYKSFQNYNLSWLCFQGEAEVYLTEAEAIFASLKFQSRTNSTLHNNIDRRRREVHCYQYFDKF